MNSFGKFFWGILLLVLGIIWLSMAMGWMDNIYVLAHWWPMLIIIPCVLRLLLSNDRWLSTMGIIIGLIWQIHYWSPELIDLHMARTAMAPIAIIFIALHMLLGGKKSRKYHHNK